MKLNNDRLIRALLREPTDATPVWVMRQAGRYLPEYRELRKKVPDFMTLCKSPDLACEVTLMPINRFDLDAAIIFSDILTIPDAMDLGLSFEKGEGPRFSRPVQDIKAIEKLRVPNVEEKLNYVAEAIKLTSAELNGKVPLIGFSGSPWTIATYMVEGGSSKDFRTIKRLMYAEPQALHLLLEKLTQAIIAYLTMQIKAGANAVMIFDTWGGVLTEACYQEFSLAYMQKIISAIPKEINGVKIPTILFTKNAGHWLETIADSGCHGVGLDWTIDIQDARRRVGDKVALQGNLDPAVLYGSPEQIEKSVKSILEKYGAGPGHIFNLGHGIALDVPPENVAVLVDAVHQYSMT